MKRFAAILSAVLLCLSCTGCGHNATNANSSKNVSAQSGASSGTTVKAGAGDLVAAAQDKDFNYGYINTKGQWVIVPQYASATPFSDGYAAVYNENVKPRVWQIIDKSGKVVAAFDKDIHVYTAINGWNDNTVLAAFLKSFSVSSGVGYISGGMVPICDAAMTKIGYATVKGKVVVEPRYSQAGAFSEGLAAVNFGTSSNAKWGYIDEQGNTVIAGQYKSARPFSSGLAYVEWEANGAALLANGSRGFIDQKGQLVIHGTGKDDVGNVLWSGFTGFISDFVNDLAVCEYSTGKDNYNPHLAVINKSGVVVWADTTDKYDHQLTAPIGDDLFRAELLSSSEKTGFLDTNGAVTIPLQSSWKCNSFFSGGLCMVKDANTQKYGYIDRSGAVVIQMQYRIATPFLNGYAVVSMDGRTYSYIDTKGKTVASGDFVNAQMPFTK